jgi:1-acyl-sn-glycerol-3-phosphate acyltransferase
MQPKKTESGETPRTRFPSFKPSYPALQIELEDEQYRPFWRLDKRSGGDLVVKFLFGLIAVPLRTLVLVLCFTLFLLLCSITRLLPLGEKRRRLTCRFFAGTLSRVIVLTLGFRITRHNCPSSLPELHGVPLVACSHVSYMDIMILLCLYQPAFLAKAEIASAPLVGPAATIMGSIYVERFSSDKKERGSSVQTMQTRVAEVALGHGPVVVFPEGTTTNGQYALLDFKTGVFRLGQPVHMFHITYPHRHFNPSYESVRFKWHWLRMCSEFSHTVHVHYFGLYTPDAAEAKDSKLFASNCAQRMARMAGRVVRFVSKSFFPRARGCTHVTRQAALRLMSRKRNLWSFASNAAIISTGLKPLCC